MMKMTNKIILTKEIADQIIDHLNGSCDPLEQACEDFGVDADEFLDKYASELDERIFNCESCGWWYEVGQHGEDPHGREICYNCEESNEEDE